MINIFMRRLTALFTALCVATSPMAWAQGTNDGTLGFDITAPTISHSPINTKGVAGKPQTVVAEISDNQTVESAMLVYRNSSADFYSTADMSADVTNTTWRAQIATLSEDEFVNYYIVAEDTDGNRVQKGSESNPLTIVLQQPVLISAATPVENRNNQLKWLGIGAGVLLVGALLVAGGGGGGDDGDEGITSSDETTEECCTITFTVPNVDTE